jgi:hypothetical protein
VKINRNIIEIFNVAKRGWRRNREMAESEMKMSTRGVMAGESETAAKMKYQRQLKICEIMA